MGPRGRWGPLLSGPPLSTKVEVDKEQVDEERNVQRSVRLKSPLEDRIGDPIERRRTTVEDYGFLHSVGGFRAREGRLGPGSDNNNIYKVI